MTFLDENLDMITEKLQNLISNEQNMYLMLGGEASGNMRELPVTLDALEEFFQSFRNDYHECSELLEKVEKSVAKNPGVLLTEEERVRTSQQIHTFYRTEIAIAGRNSKLKQILKSLSESGIPEYSALIRWMQEYCSQAMSSCNANYELMIHLKNLAESSVKREEERQGDPEEKMIPVFGSGTRKGILLEESEPRQPERGFSRKTGSGDISQGISFESSPEWKREQESGEQKSGRKRNPRWKYRRKSEQEPGLYQEISRSLSAESSSAESSSVESSFAESERICSQCGQKLSEDSLFCPECGARFEK